MVDYGYGDATPDVRQYYGYEDDTDVQSIQHDDVAKYGYEDMDISPKQNSVKEPRPQGRRSSMKHAGASRRSSIGYTGEITNLLPGNRTARRRTSITFDDSTTEIREVQPVTELTDKPEELWFQQEEYNLIREKACLLTKIACSSDGRAEQLEQKKLCLRGLESHINAAYVEHEQILAWKSVFYEQYHQRQHGDFDDEVVARLYEMASMPSRARALERAQGDSRDAEKHTRGVRSRFGRRHSTLT